MKKEKEKVIEQISKNKEIANYFIKKMLSIYIFSLIAFGYTIYVLEDATELISVILGIVVQIYSLWTIISNMIELGNLLYELDDNKKSDK